MTLLRAALHPTDVRAPVSWRAKTYVAALVVALPALVPPVTPVFDVLPGFLVGLVFAAVSAGVVVAACDRPWVGVVGACAVGALMLAYQVEPVMLFALLLAVMGASAWHRPTASIGIAVLTAAVALLLLAIADLIVPGAALAVVGIGASLALALVLRVSAAIAIDRERQLFSRAAEVTAREDVVAERARLAHDLHDVVAHHVSLIAVRAETAPYTHPRIGDEARGVLAEIAADARLALDELRGVLGILGRSGAQDRAPQPTWGDVADLVDRTRSAGTEVVLSGDVQAAVGASVGYVAYRVVQESVTNARKHAPGSPVSVELHAGALVVVTVRSRLAPGARATAGGHGLAGMRERVEGMGGRLTVGPRAGEFVVEAVLPGSGAA